MDMDFLTQLRARQAQSKAMADHLWQQQQRAGGGPQQVLVGSPLPIPCSTAFPAYARVYNASHVNTDSNGDVGSDAATAVNSEGSLVGSTASGTATTLSPAPAPHTRVSSLSATDPSALILPAIFSAFTRDAAGNSQWFPNAVGAPTQTRALAQTTHSHSSLDLVQRRESSSAAHQQRLYAPYTVRSRRSWATSSTSSNSTEESDTCGPGGIGGIQPGHHCQAQALAPTFATRTFSQTQQHSLAAAAMDILQPTIPTLFQGMRPFGGYHNGPMFPATPTPTAANLLPSVPITRSARPLPQLPPFTSIIPPVVSHNSGYPLPSQQLDSAPRIGPYTLHHALGKGSYGIVYLASTPSGELVAIKRVALYINDRDKVAGGNGKGKRTNPHVVGEISSLSRVRGSENVVQLIDVIYTTNHANIILDYHHGIDVLRFMEARKRRKAASATPLPENDAGSLPEDFVRLIVHDACKALVDVHARGVVHRDVKLDNILISPHTGTSKLIDFNLSSPIHQQSTTEEIVFTRPAGSLHYCAPAVLRTCLDNNGEATQQGYSARGGWLDVYSLGVACYSMLVGRFPFPGANAGEILQAYYNKQGRCFTGDEVKVLTGGVSRLAREFVETCVDVERGFKAAEMLKHPWFEGL